MQDHQQDSRYGRVRNVPIHVESRDEPNDGGVNHNGQERRQDHRRFHPNQYQPNNQEDQNEQSQNEQLHNTRDQRMPPPDNYTLIDPDDPASQLDRQFDFVRASHDKENSDRKHKGRATRSRQNAGETEYVPRNSRHPIPLPPPPEQPKTSKDSHSKDEKSKQKQSKNQLEEQQDLDQQQQQQHLDQLRQQDQLQQQQQQQQQQEEEENIESKKAKKDNGPMGVISATKAEALRLLKEITSCSETSLKSKEFLRLDELLTRCILKLDDIQCSELPELRQQRKAVIELIDKCTDILQRKVKLNHDIQQITAKSA